METSEVAKKYEEMVRSLTYPSKPPKPIQSNYKNNADFGAAMDAWEIEKDKWLGLVKEYQNANNRVNLSFKKDLLEALEITDNPKADTLFKMAWDRGHAYGYYEVANAAENLTELL